MSGEPSKQRFALVDVNNFYASCETVFNPKLRNRSVVVLSNNDGCVVARSAQAKALQIKMAQPWHKVPKSIQDQTIAYSSNYALYADMSSRVMTILKDMAPSLEVYSIDESFLDVTGIPNLQAHGLTIRYRVGQWTGLTVCVGIGSTKTRAKLANHIAKKHPQHAGVFNLEDISAVDEYQLLNALPVNEIWGVGHQLTRHLSECGIKTVWDLKVADPKALRQRFGVVVERIVAELNGQSCLDLELLTPPRKQIRCSRSFGRSVTDLHTLKEATLAYVSRAAEKLRGQGSTARAINVFVMTNAFKPEQPQYANTVTLKLPFATDDTLTLAKFALLAIEGLYRSGFQYKKTGINLMQLEPKAQGQLTLFECPKKLARRDRLNSALDGINKRFGRDTLLVGRTTGAKIWNMNQTRLSPNYTTSVDEVVWAR